MKRKNKAFETAFLKWHFTSKKGAKKMLNFIDYTNHNQGQVMRKYAIVNNLGEVGELCPCGFGPCGFLLSGF